MQPRISASFELRSGRWKLGNEDISYGSVPSVFLLLPSSPPAKRPRQQGCVWMRDLLKGLPRGKKMVGRWVEIDFGSSFNFVIFFFTFTVQTQDIFVSLLTRQGFKLLSSCSLFWSKTDWQNRSEYVESMVESLHPLRSLQRLVWTTFRVLHSGRIVL